MNKFLFSFSSLKMITFFFYANAFASTSMIILLNILNVPYRDDWCMKLANFSNIFSLPFQFYMHFSGRFFLTFTQALIIYLPHSIFSIFNILVTLSLFYVLLRLATEKITLSRYTFALAFGLIFMWFLHGFGEIMLWKTASIGYLWTGTGILAWLLPYRRFALEDVNAPQWGVLKKWSFYCASFVVGNAIDNTGFCAALIASSALGYAHYFRKVFVPRYYIYAILCVFAGWVFLVAAPGNYIRAASVAMFTWKFIAQNMAWIFRAWGNPLFSLPVVYAIFKLLYDRQSVINCAFQIKLAYVFFFFAFLNMMPLVLVPIASRSFAGSYFLMLVGYLILSFYWIDTYGERILLWLESYKKELSTGLCVCFLALMLSYANTLWSYGRSYIYYQSMMQTVQGAKNVGQKTVLFKRVESPYFDERNYRDRSGLTADPTHWTNKCFASCYGFDHVFAEQ